MPKKTTVRERLESCPSMEGIAEVTLGSEAGLVIQAVFGSGALETSRGLEVKDEEKLAEWLRACSDVDSAVTLYRALVEIYSP